MTATTLKHQIGSYLFKTIRVPMRNKRNQVIRYKDGRIRMRHLENFSEFKSLMKNKLH